MAHESLLAEFTVEDEKRARVLLGRYGFVEEDGWSEERRFLLYDCLSRIAFELADEAINCESADAMPLYKASNVAQCAMDIVARQGPFTPETLTKLLEPANDR